MRTYASALALLVSMSTLGCDGASVPSARETTSHVIGAPNGGSVDIFDTVAGLKGIPSTDLDAKSQYILRGYTVAGDTTEGTLNWMPSSTIPADDIFVFQPTVKAGMAGRFIRVESGTFDARKGGLKMDGTAAQGAKLMAIYSACNNYTSLNDYGAGGAGGSGSASAHVIDKLWLGPGTLNISDGVTLAAGAVSNGAAKSIAIVGAGKLATTIVGNPHGSNAQQFGVFTSLAEAENPYGTHTWTQNLSAGMGGASGFGGAGGLAGAGTTTFPGVASASDFSPGDWVWVRLGVDPTDNGLPFEVLITQVTAVSGGNVTVAAPVRENVPFANSSMTRQWNKHDIFKITALFDGFELADVALDNVVFSANKTVGTYVHDVRIPWTTAAFNNAYDENTVVERLTAEMVVKPPAGYFGWFTDGWLHFNMAMRDIEVQFLGVNLFTSEGQSRGMTVSNMTVDVDARPAGSIVVTSAAEPVQFNDLTLTGYGSIAIGGAGINGLTVVGTLGLAGNPNLDVQTTASLVSKYLFFNGRQYDQVEKGTSMAIPLSPSTTIYAPFPLKGVPRRVRILPSTLTGVTVSQQAGYLTSGLNSFLTPGQYAEPGISTQLGVNYPGGGISESQQLIISTDSTVPAGAYIQVESEFWTASTEVGLQPPPQIVGSGAPTANANFISQRYYDSTNHEFYQAIRTGLGAGDWVLTGP